MDLPGQLASVWLRRYLVVAVAVAVALVVLSVRALAPPVYTAAETVRVDVGGSTGADRSETAAFAAQTVVGLAGTNGVLADAADRSDLALTATEIADQVRVREAETPGFLTIEADGPTPDEAVRLAGAMTTTLTARLAEDNRTAVDQATAPLRDQLAALEQQLETLPAGSIARNGTEQRYTAVVGAVTDIESRPGPSLILGPPTAPPTDAVSPTPLRDALLALVITLILFSEGIVLVRAAYGRLSEADPAARVRREVGLPTVVLDASADPETALASLYRERLRGARLITLVQLSREGALDLGETLTAAAALLGDRRAHVVAPAPSTSGDRGVVRSIRTRELDRSALRAIGPGPGPVLLGVDTSTARAARLAPDVAALRALGFDVVAVLVWRGRFPRTRVGGSSATQTSESVKAVY